MIEVWKDVVGYEGLYQVSNFGQVKNTKRQKVLIPQTNTWGYKHILLHKNGTRKTVTIHKLVVDAFITTERAGLQVNHKDENKSNNRLDNLELCTPAYNMNYGTGNDRRAAKVRKPILQINSEGKIINTFISARQAHELFGYCYKHISDCCLGRRHTHAGCYWRFA